MIFRAGLVVLVLFFASCLVSGTEGLKCYKCVLCDDPFDSNGVETSDCNGTCTKGKSPQGIARDCLSMKVSEGCSTMTQDGVSIDACFCNEDLCNTGSVQRISFYAGVMMLAVMFLDRLFF